MNQDHKKKAIIFVFSGTGNTLKAAEAVAEKLQSFQIVTEIVPADLSVSPERKPGAGLEHTKTFDTSDSPEKNPGSLERPGLIHTSDSPEKNPGSLPEGSLKQTGFEEGTAQKVPDPNGYDMALFAYPVHAFNTPRYFLRFVRSLPDLEGEKRGMPAYVFKTSGEPFRPNRASSFALFRILKKKGFQPQSDMHMLMPYNIMFRYPDAMAKQMYLHTTGPMAEALARQVAEGRAERIRFNPLRVLVSWMFRLQWFGALINGPMIHADKNRCSRCGLCANRCPARNIRMKAEPSPAGRNPENPARNIRMKETPSFGWKCTMCMRCAMECPKDAIKPGFLTLWKVNPSWNFEKLMEDETIPASWTDSENPGYFKLFRKYYSRNPAKARAEEYRNR